MCLEIDERLYGEEQQALRYPMDIADADESMYAAMRRSTNGGGENSPHLKWQEEAFDALMEEIREL